MHKRIVVWKEVPLLVEWWRNVAIWRQRELKRRERERQASATLLQAWVRACAVRHAAPVMTSNAKSLGEAVTELFRPGVPAVQLPLSASVEDMQEISQKKRCSRCCRSCGLGVWPGNSTASSWASRARVGFRLIVRLDLG